VHAPFYSKINEALGLANDKFYTEYVNDPLLKDRVETLEKYADANNPYEFLIMLALAEGVILYSSFAFLKHFQSQGKNKINNIVRGINFSTRDEGLHSEASAWLFRTLATEEGANLSSLKDTAYKLAQTVREHEYAIVDMIFSRGSIEGITDVQMKHFVDSRVNLVLRNLGFDNLYTVNYNPIADWFYDGINNYVSNDFFAGVGREYVRTWDEEELAW
jgi:ribonucleoside-diphosphate reductase beta chain